MLPGSLVATDSCQQVTGSQVLAFQVPGPIRFRIRVAPNGRITDERPLRARSLVKRVDEWKLNLLVRRVVYRLGGRRIAVRKRAPYAVTIGPALLRRASRQTLTVRVVPRRGKPRIARACSSTAVPALRSSAWCTVPARPARCSASESTA